MNNLTYNIKLKEKIKEDFERKDCHNCKYNFIDWLHCLSICSLFSKVTPEFIDKIARKSEIFKATPIIYIYAVPDEEGIERYKSEYYKKGLTNLENKIIIPVFRCPISFHCDSFKRGENIKWGDVD